jgi:hypothetical protein
MVQKAEAFGEIDTIPTYKQTIDASFVDAVLQNVGRVDPSKY